MPTNPKITPHQKEIAEIEIREQRKAISYDTVSYSLKYLCEKISQSEIEKNLHWNEQQQSYFIESLLLGLPVLNIVIKRNGNDADAEIEVIDGVQRLYTVINFINNNLILSNLKELAALNDFQFEDLLFYRQKKIERYSVRAIIVDHNSDTLVWRKYK